MGIYIYGLEGKTAASRRKVEGFPKPKDSTIADFQFIGKLNYSFFAGIPENEDKLKDKGKKKFWRSWGYNNPDYVIVENFLCKVEKEAWDKLVSQGEDFVNYDVDISNKMFEPGEVFRIIGIVDSIAPEHKEYKLIYSGYLKDFNEAMEVYNQFYRNV